MSDNSEQEPNNTIAELKKALCSELGTAEGVEATKRGKRRQGESNEQEKIKEIRPSKEVFNKYASQTNGYSLEFDRESQSEQSLNFDKIQ